MEIANGSSLKTRSANYSSENIGRELGWFDATDNSKYTISFYVKQASADLNNLDPRLSIEISPTAYKDEIVFAMLLTQLAIFTFCAGILIFVIWSGILLLNKK